MHTKLNKILKFGVKGRQRGRVVRVSDLKSVARGFKCCWPLADVVLGSPEYNFSATLGNSQLVCLPPVGILNLVMFIWILIYHCLHWSWKAQLGSGQLSIHYTLHYIIDLKVSKIQPFENVKIYKEMYGHPGVGRCMTQRPDAIHFSVNFGVFKSLYLSQN